MRTIYNWAGGYIEDEINEPYDMLVNGKYIFSRTERVYCKEGEEKDEFDDRYSLCELLTRVEDYLKKSDDATAHELAKQLDAWECDKVEVEQLE